MYVYHLEQTFAGFAQSMLTKKRSTWVLIRETRHLSSSTAEWSNLAANAPPVLILTNNNKKGRFSIFALDPRWLVTTAGSYL